MRIDPYHIGGQAAPSVNFSQSAAMLQDGSAFTGTDYTMTTAFVAVKFTATDAHTMGDFLVRIRCSALLTNPTATLTGSIRADDGTSPSKPSAVLATGQTIRFSALTTSYQTLSFGTTHTLVSGTAYWLVLARDAAPTGGNILLDSDVSANMGATSTDGTSWTNTNARLFHQLRGLTGVPVQSFSTNNTAMSGSSVNNPGVSGSSINGPGIFGTSNEGLGGLIDVNSATTNAVVEALRIRRRTTGASANNIGAAIDFYAPNSVGSSILTARIAGMLGGVTAGSEQGAIVFSVRSSGTFIERMRIQHTGAQGLSINSTLTHSHLIVAGSFSVQLTSIAVDLTLSSLYHTILVDASAGSRTITLPTANGLTGRIYIIKKMDSSANAVIIDGHLTETIDDAATRSITTQYDVIRIQAATATTWVRI